MAASVSMRCTLSLLEYVISCKIGKSICFFQYPTVSNQGCPLRFLPNVFTHISTMIESVLSRSIGSTSTIIVKSSNSIDNGGNRSATRSLSCFSPPDTLAAIVSHKRATLQANQHPLDLCIPQLIRLSVLLRGLAASRRMTPTYASSKLCHMKKTMNFQLYHFKSLDK